MEKRIYSKLKYYLKEIKANAKVFYDEKTFINIAYDRKHPDCKLISLSYLVCLTIVVITPLTFLSFVFNNWNLMFICCIFWALVLYYILAVLFRNL